jgi:ABC-type branched-subunit amino acid transport system substrate-binding protein
MKQYAQYIPNNLIFPGLPYLARQAASPKERAVQDTFYDAFKPLGIVPDLIQSFSWDPASIVIDALRTVGPDASADQIRQYIENLHDYIGINGIYDFRDGSQRGLGVDSALIMRWDPEKLDFVTVSKGGGTPM